MSRWSSHPHVALLCVVLLLSACDGPAEPTLDPPEAEPAVNTAPRVWAGPDLQVSLPVKTAWLRGSATDEEANIVSHRWARVSGPSTTSIAYPYLLHTAANGLEAGQYEFELVVRDDGGLEGRDTVVIQVLDPPPLVEVEVVFENLAWSCYWGCVLLVEDIPEHLTTRTVTGVFLQHGNDPAWVGVRPAIPILGSAARVWIIRDGSLVIFDDAGSVISDLTPARVKVRFVRPPGT